MLIEKKINDFLAETASKSPAPGGGSAAALAGALGVALSEMVINLTVGKKKYLEVSEELATLLPKLRDVRTELQTAIDEDTAAFNEVMAAFGMPKETDDEKAVRRKAIQDATLKATEVPLSVMEKALRGLEMTLTIALKGNKNSASDAGVAGLLLCSAIDGAAYNVKINLPGLPEEMPFRIETEKRIGEIDRAKNKLWGEITEAVGNNI